MSEHYNVDYEFPFPPNGKVLFKGIYVRLPDNDLPKVSIPSERESAFQVQQPIRIRINGCVSIPSERESAFQASPLRRLARTHGKFPFPPNGKVLFKYMPEDHLPGKKERCFHSLRTGKCFSSQPEQTPELQLYTGFHSLRTGKCFASGRPITEFRQRGKSFDSLRTGKCFSSSVVLLRSS